MNLQQNDLHELQLLLETRAKLYDCINCNSKDDPKDKDRKILWHKCDNQISAIKSKYQKRYVKSN